MDTPLSPATFRWHFEATITDEIDKKKWRQIDGWFGDEKNTWIIAFKRRQNIQQNDILRNDIEHNDTQHNGIEHNDTQRNDIEHNDIQHNNIKH